MCEGKMTVVALGAVIRQYLVRHPHAADSLEGVAQCWLTGLSAKVTLPVIQAALDQLVEERCIARTELVDGTVLYLSVDAR